MSRQFSIPTVLRMVPNVMLKAFFRRLGLDDDEFPWDKLGEREVQPMIKWISLMPRSDQNTVEASLRQIFDLSCHSGVEALFESAANCGDLNMPAEMPKDAGLYAKAMWAWLHRPEAFEKATLIHQVEHIAWWRKRWDLPQREPDTSEVALARLRRKISELLLTTQGRGQVCTVEPLSRLDGTDYFFAYPDDFVQSFTCHDEDGQLASRTIRPTFSIVFAYRRDEGSLELFGKVPASLKRRCEETFAESVLGASLGPWNPRAVYELDHLKHRSFRLQTDPDDRLRVRIRSMHLALRNCGRRLWVGVDVDDPDDDIYRALDEMLNKEHASLPDVFVTRIRFCFDFLPLDGRLPGRLQFDVGRPNTCSLRNARPDYVELCRKYLRLWYVDCGRHVELPLAATGS
jgi:hypothetical protein